MLQQYFVILRKAARRRPGGAATLHTWRRHFAYTVTIIVAFA